MTFKSGWRCKIRIKENREIDELNSEIYRISKKIRKAETEIRKIGRKKVALNNAK